MPIKDDREYRSFASYEIEKRANEEADYIVKGYASTFAPYTLAKREGMEWREQIDPHAFEDADMFDVVFLRDHTGQVFARTKNDTVKLTVDEKGLFTETDLSKTSSARAMFEDIEAGNYQQMSFAFIVEDDAFDERSEGDLRIVTRTITKIRKLFDVSAVAFPANPTTDISVATRNAFGGAIEAFEAERLKRAAEVNESARKRLALRLKLEES